MENWLSFEQLTFHVEMGQNFVTLKFSPTWLAHGCAPLVCAYNFPVDPIRLGLQHPTFSNWLFIGDYKLCQHSYLKWFVQEIPPPPNYCVCNTSVLTCKCKIKCELPTWTSWGQWYEFKWCFPSRISKHSTSTKVKLVHERRGTS